MEACVVLDRVHGMDLVDWYRIHADPRVWTHVPSGRHTSPEQTEQLVQSRIEAWREAAWRDAGLSYWTVRERVGGRAVGCGGCRPVPDQNRWNRYYRFDLAVQGLGYATELAGTAHEPRRGSTRLCR